MTTPTFRRPLAGQTPARRPAVRPGVTLLATGLLALLAGGLFLLMGLFLPRMTDDPNVRQMIADLHERVDVDPATLFLTTSGVLAAYALAALTLGIGLLTGGRRWRTSALSFCCAIGGLLALMTLSAAVTANAGGVLEGVLLIGPHALAIWWLLGAPAATGVPVAPVRLQVSPRWPMQEYYTPPTPPDGAKGQRIVSRSETT